MTRSAAFLIALLPAPLYGIALPRCVRATASAARSDQIRPGTLRCDGKTAECYLRPNDRFHNINCYKKQSEK
ncbi:MAG: hypothetical protein LBB08_00775 [Rickettsiales bacterium]|jgi:hypothetical protein|nr:hypothetical protein [Rickettsiales bacterium]